MCYVTYIHGKVYMKKKMNTKVRKHNLGGSENERTGWFRMLRSISGWRMHYYLDKKRDIRVYGDHLRCH